MRNIDFLIAPGWVALVSQGPEQLAAGVHTGHGVAVDDGRICGVGPLATLLAEFQPAERVDLPGQVLIPGLVNAHTHSSMALMRGIADDLPLGEWLQNHIWPLEGQFVSNTYVRDGARLAIAEMLLGGTTCFNDMYFYPDEVARCAIDAGIRCVTGLIVIDFPTVWARDANEYIDKAIEVHDAFRDSPLVTTAFAPHAPYTVSDAPLERLRVLSDELDVPVHTHVHETAQEIADHVAAHGRRPIARMDELGLLGPRLIAVHMVVLEDREIELVGERGVSVAHCPESNLKLASGISPIGRLQAAGVNLAIGTDGAASNNDLCMLGEMRTASLLAKGSTGDARALAAPDALRAATLGGAIALGLDERIGSIEVGKEADLVAIDLSAPRTQPVYDPVSLVVNAAAADQVSNVWVLGRRVVRDGALTTLNVSEVTAAAAQWGERMREARAHPPGASA